ncbi:Extradiol ring-cleavage dioxygenase, class III enzyme, subunit B [Xylariales sp. PMI_506]|nr:Extradiol ring-cleavage dioxygenase, class III enzyme, subunit B [Xylariales sp. PMI_506]
MPLAYIGRTTAASIIIRSCNKSASTSGTHYIRRGASIVTASRRCSISTTSIAMVRGAAICVSHGGGPMPVLGDPNHKDIVQSLTTRVPKILRLGTPEAPRAIIVVTAHWSTSQPTISSGSRHSLYYDYGGFPPESYKLKYDAPGSPEVAEEVRVALANAGFDPVMDSKRGWDHGVFIPFLLINPAADIPIVQLSVLRSEDPREHLRLGQALSALRDTNVAIVGSGFASFHNLRLMMPMLYGQGSGGKFQNTVKAWNAKVTEAVSHPKLEDRGAALDKWRDIPNSYDMHPPHGAEHFLPLIVTAGSAGDDAKCKSYKDEFVTLDIWTYFWDEDGTSS